jgi:hypothetical protein
VVFSVFLGMWLLKLLGKHVLLSPAIWAALSSHPSKRCEEYYEAIGGSDNQRRKFIQWAFSSQYIDLLQRKTLRLPMLPPSTSLL